MDADLMNLSDSMSDWYQRLDSEKQRLADELIDKVDAVVDIHHIGLGMVLSALIGAFLIVWSIQFQSFALLEMGPGIELLLVCLFYVASIVAFTPIISAVLWLIYFRQKRWRLVMEIIPFLQTEPWHTLYAEIALIDPAYDRKLQKCINQFKS